MGIGLLKGSLPFMHELVSRITVPVVLDYIGVHSYQGTESSCKVNFRSDIQMDAADKHVLVVDDIVDTGTTMVWVKEHLLKKQPCTLQSCVMLDKRARRTQEIEVDYIGWEIPNKFVVGFGLDFNQKFRNIPYVAVLHPDA